MGNQKIISVLLQQIEEGYHSKSWHGTNLRGSLRGLTIEQASWRPSANRHNIWEIVVHCAYWKYVVWRRLTNEKRGRFLFEGNNFFERPVEKTKAAWKKDIQLLDDMHFLLVQAVTSLHDGNLAHHPKGSTFSNRETISGIAMHDVYHAGQIQLLKHLMK